MELSAIYVALTEGALHTLSLSHEEAHLWGALLIYCAVVSLPLARRHMGLPFGTVVVVQLMNELVQAAHYGSPRAKDTLSDFIWTLTVPAIIYGLTAVLRDFPLPKRVDGASAQA